MSGTDVAYGAMGCQGGCCVGRRATFQQEEARRSRLLGRHTLLVMAAMSLRKAKTVGCYALRCASHEGCYGY
eukprot:1204540-Rhodomonas_salina.4